jgi:hypothetical protein
VGFGQTGFAHQPLLQPVRTRNDGAHLRRVAQEAAQELDTVRKRPPTLVRVYR